MYSFCTVAILFVSDVVWFSPLLSSHLLLIIITHSTEGYLFFEG